MLKPSPRVTGVATGGAVLGLLFATWVLSVACPTSPAPQSPRSQTLQRFVAAIRSREQLSPAVAEQLALTSIDEIAAHPEDPLKPRDVRGVSDAELAGVDPDEIKLLLEACHAHAWSVRSHRPRYLFQLGRAALAAGKTDEALALFEEASRSGSFAALAFYAMNANLSGPNARYYLMEAARAGFAPAAGWAEDYGKYLSSAFQPATDQTFSAFQRPDILLAIHNRDVTGLEAGTLEVWAYLANLIEGLKNPQLLALVEREEVPILLALQEPGLKELLEAELLGNPEYVRETTRVGIGGFLSGLQKVAEVRRDGGSINDEMSAFTRQINDRRVPLEVAKQQAAQDAMTIGLDLESHGPAVSEVMRGVHWYLDRGVQEHRAILRRALEGRQSGVPSLEGAFSQWIERRALR